MEVNRIYKIDVLEGLKMLEDNSVDLIITSPPYNKAGLNGIIKRSKGHKWVHTIDYGGDVNTDCMNEEEYQNWQIEILNECYRVLKTDGSMFYNHKNRIKSGSGEIISPYEWLYKCKFKIRQELIWDRGSTNNVKECRYLPTTEKIYWLTKTFRPIFKRNKKTKYKTEIWSFPFERNTKHPAPFPIEIPDNIMKCIPDKEGKIVLDPFIGSGTVAVAAIKNGMNYIGFEKFEEYVKMAEDRLKMEAPTVRNCNPYEG